MGFCLASVEWEEAVSIAEDDGVKMPYDMSGVIPCRDDQLVNVAVMDHTGVVVESHEAMDVNLAGDLARKFLILHGGDPDEGGRGAQPGSINFVPVSG